MGNTSSTVRYSTVCTVRQHDTSMKETQSHRALLDISTESLLLRAIRRRLRRRVTRGGVLRSTAHGGVVWIIPRLRHSRRAVTSVDVSCGSPSRCGLGGGSIRRRLHHPWWIRAHLHRPVRRHHDRPTQRDHRGTRLEAATLGAVTTPDGEEDDKHGDADADAYEKAKIGFASSPWVPVGHGDFG